MIKEPNNALAKIGTVLKNIIITIVMVVVLAIFVMSVLFTTLIVNYTVGYDFLNIGQHCALVGVIVAIALLCLNLLILRLKFFRNMKESQIITVATVTALVMSVAWVVLADVVPFSDDKNIFLVGVAMAQREKAWLNDFPYYQAFPYQAAMELIIGLFYKVFQVHAVKALQLLQCVCAASTVAFVSLMCSELFSNKRATFVCCLLLIGFFPLYFYTTFIYGHVMALPFLFAALWLQMRWFNRQRWYDAVLAGICVSICLLFKSSYAAVLIAMLITWVLHSLSSRKLGGMGFAVFAAIAFVTLNAFVLRTSVTVSGCEYETDRSIPTLGNLAMGLHDNPPRSIGPGWFDAWIWDQDYETKAEFTEACKDDIRASFDNFAGDPQRAAEFFGRKLVSEWTEPTYLSLLYSNCTMQSNDWPYPGYTNYGREVSPVVNGIYYGVTNTVLMYFLDGLQSLIYGMALVYLIKGRYSIQIHEVTPLLMLAGGFILFTFWEAKSQYVMVYVLAMIPYAACGLTLIADSLRVRHERALRKETR